MADDGTCAATVVERKSEWRCRLLKAKCLLLEVSKAERVVKNRLLLELLCAGVALCAESEKRTHKDDEEDEEHKDNEAMVAEAPSVFRAYFLDKLHAHLVKLHAASLVTKGPETAEPPSGFLQSVQFVQQRFPEHFDDAFQVRPTRQSALWEEETSPLPLY